MTRISVVMPTHNRAAILPRAIGSVLHQTHADWELVVVDDGSTDRTPALMASYADPRIRYIRNEGNRGGNWARNRGIERTTGEIVAFLDSDDEFLPEKLAVVADTFGRRPEIDVLLDSYEVRHPPEVRKPARPRRNPAIEEPEAFRRGIFGRQLYKATPAISARRQALIDVGMFDETLRRRQDMDLLLRLARRHRCIATDRPLWIKHWTPDAISGKRSTFLAAVIDICERHPEYLEEASYRRGLDRDLGRHFVRLIGAGEFAQLRRDLRRYHDWGRFGVAPWRLVLRRLSQRLQRRVRPG